MIETIARRNTLWQSRVKSLLRSGLGVEDIAVKLSSANMPCTADDVRAEVQILRLSGVFAAWWGRP